MKIAVKSNPFPETGNLERAATVIAGTLLAYYGARKRSVLGVGMALLGASLVRRGAVGKSVFGETTLPRLDRSIVIDKPKEEVFAFWRALENLPKFMSRLRSVKATGPETSRWIAVGPGGQAMEWDARLINEIENELIAWKTLPCTSMAHSGSVRFEDAAGGRGCIVRVSISYNAPGGRAGTALAKLFGANPAAILTEDLRSLKALLETGQVANVVGQVSGKPADTLTKRAHEDKMQDANEGSFPASDAPTYR